MAGDPIEAVKADDFIGQVLDGRYRIDGVLGQGGMGMVFRAVQTSMSRPVAVKLLHPQLALAPTFFERFKREAEVASRLHHPNIITIFDFGRSENGACYYVMELLEGESLRQQVRRLGPMSLRRAVAVIEQIGLGVGHAHKQGVVHRDLKPHNVMVSEVDGAEYIKVLDFGLVKAVEEAEDEQQLTSTGQVLGTPQYMPPEQAGGEAVDQRSDLYSLAGILYFCLTGTSPYGANTVRKALTAALTKPVPPVATHRQGAPVPRAIDELLRKGLAKEKEDRYQTCDELMLELQRAVQGLTAEQLDALPSKVDKKDSASGSQSGAGSSKKAGSERPSSKVGSSAGKPLPKAESSSASRKSGVGKATPLPVKPNDDLHRRITAPDVPVPGVPARKPLGLAVPVVTALAAVAAGALLWVVLRPSSVPPEPVRPVQAKAEPAKVPRAEPNEAIEPPAAIEVRVRVSTKPAGASVSEHGVLLGRTPMELVWPKSAAKTLTFQLAGYQEQSKALRLEADTEVEVELVQAPRKGGGASGKSTKKKDRDAPQIEAFE